MYARGDIASRASGEIGIAMSVYNGRPTDIVGENDIHNLEGYKKNKNSRHVANIAGKLYCYAGILPFGLLWSTISLF